MSPFPACVRVGHLRQDPRAPKYGAFRRQQAINTVPLRGSGLYAFKFEVATVEMLSGAEMVVRALQDEGVEYIFGYPGGSVLHIYDALFQQDSVSHILVRHEQALSLIHI